MAFSEVFFSFGPARGNWNRKNARSANKVTTKSNDIFLNEFKAQNMSYVLGFMLILPYICLYYKLKEMTLYIAIFFLISFLVFEVLFYRQEKMTVGQSFFRDNYQSDAKPKWLHLLGLLALMVVGFVLVFVLSPICIVSRLRPEKKRQVKFELDFYSALECSNELKDQFLQQSASEMKYFESVTNELYTPDEDEVIYVDRINNQAFRAHLQEHENDLKTFIRHTSLHFTDLKPFCNQTVGRQQEVYNYYAPYANTSVDWQADQLQDEFLAMLIGSENVNTLTSGFLHWNKHFNKYAFFELKPEDEFSFAIQIKWYFTYTDNNASKPRFRLVKREDLPYDERSDFSMDDDIKNIVDELKEKIAKLQDSGVSDYFIRELVNKETPNAYKISHLKVTKNYDIVLTDYNNMLIEMTPLAKTVFLFFLKHPEGILLKEISNYKPEIVKIYNRITGRTDADKIEKTIDDLVNPMKNRLNENCTRVREAFIAKFEESLAKNYYIHGPWREPKKIDLPRDLVIWEDN